MAISATRFEGFARDFNLPTKDFNSLREVGIFNTPETGFKDFLESAQNMADQARNNFIEGLGIGDALKDAKGLVDNAKGIASGVSNAVAEAARMAKGVFDSVADLATASVDMINGVIDDVFGGFPKDILNAVKSVGSICRNEALATGISLGVNIGSAVNCSGMNVGSKNCPPGATGNLSASIGNGFGAIGDSINGVLGAVSNGLNSIKKGVQALASLLSIGYSANLCNVFSAVVDKLGISDNSILGVAAAGILSKEGLKGSVNAVFDIAKSSVGNLASLAPAALKNTAQNLAIGAALNSDNIKHVSNSLTSSFDAIDSFWNKTESGIVSVAKTGLKNATAGALFDYQKNTSTFDIHDIDKVDSSDLKAYSTAYNAQPKEASLPSTAPKVKVGSIVEYGEPHPRAQEVKDRAPSARQLEKDKKDKEQGYSARGPIVFVAD